MLRPATHRHRQRSRSTAERPRLTPPVEVVRRLGRRRTSIVDASRLHQSSSVTPRQLVTLVATKFCRTSAGLVVVLLTALLLLVKLIAASLAVTVEVSDQFARLVQRAALIRVTSRTINSSQLLSGGGLVMSGRSSVQYNTNILSLQL